MRLPVKKARDSIQGEDDSLFGLLSSYKVFNTYFRIMESQKDGKIAVVLTNNPKKWEMIPKERFSGYRQLRRLEIGVLKLSVKYLSPDHIVKHMGSLLGTKLPSKKVVVTNSIGEEGYFIIETSVKFKPAMLQSIRKIINLSPQKKYEILEKCLSEISPG